MEVIIRAAETGDIDELLVLNEEFNGVIAGRKQLADPFSGELVAVAAVEGELAAFACAQCYESFCYDSLQGEITELFVRPSFRRQGVATMLIVFLERKLTERGCSAVRILTSAGNNTAQSLYSSIGYIRKDEVVFDKMLDTGMETE